MPNYLDASSISSLKSPNKVVKIGVMEKVLDEVDVADYGAKTAIADTNENSIQVSKTSDTGQWRRKE